MAKLEPITLTIKVRNIEDWRQWAAGIPVKKINAGGDLLQVVLKEDLEDALKSIPVSAEHITEKRGTWVESKEHIYTGDSCKEWVVFYCSECDAPSDTPYPHCPHCGIKMEGLIK